MAEDNAPVDDFDDAPKDDAPATGEDALGDAGKKALDAMKAERNEATKRAKQLERELAQVRQASMTDAEKAVAEAEARGRSQAVADYGKRLVRSEFAAEAARRNPEFDTATVLDFLDLSRLVGDDGEPDTKAIRAAVERVVPGATRPGGDVGQGPRGNEQPQDMNTLIRQMATRR